MTYPKDVYRLGKQGTRPGHGGAFHSGERRHYNAERAKFCIEQCPHPDKPCGKAPCPEYRSLHKKRD